MQVGVEGRHVPGEEPSVGADGIARQRGLPRLGHPLTDVVEHEFLGLVQGDASRQFVQQAGGGVHGTDDVHHGVDGLVRGTDHHVDAVTEHVQL